MKIKALFLAAVVTVAGACNNTSEPPAPQNSATADKPVRSDRAQSMTEHTLESKPGQQPAASNTAPGQGGRWAQGGTPIDTKEFDAAIAAADKALAAKPNDAAAKAAAAEAYFKRGFALTEARQYASALGDLRKAQKIDPDHVEAKRWENEIVGIYQMMKKEYPKPGEEPPPLPFKS
jgi:tetratricopeptide (TPR) repeat protein